MEKLESNQRGQTSTRAVTLIDINSDQVWAKFVTERPLRNFMPNGPQ